MFLRQSINATAIPELTSITETQTTNGTLTLTPPLQGFQKTNTSSSSSSTMPCTWMEPSGDSLFTRVGATFGILSFFLVIMVLFCFIKKYKSWKRRTINIAPLQGMQSGIVHEAVTPIT